MLQKIYATLAICSCSLLIIESAMGARPLSTEDTGTAGMYVSEIEFGTRFGKGAEGSNGDMALVLNHGVATRIDFSLEVPAEQVPESSGYKVNRFFGAIKILMMEEVDYFPDLSFKILSEFSSNSNSNIEFYGITCLTAFSKSFNIVTVHWNFGYTFSNRSIDEPVHDSLILGFAIELQLIENLSFVNEIVIESDSENRINGFKNYVYTPLSGFSLELLETITLDSAYYLSVQNSDITEHGFLAGITAAFYFGDNYE